MLSGSSAVSGVELSFLLSPLFSSTTSAPKITPVQKNTAFKYPAPKPPPSWQNSLDHFPTIHNAPAQSSPAAPSSNLSKLKPTPAEAASPHLRFLAGPSSTIASSPRHISRGCVTAGLQQNASSSADYTVLFGSGGSLLAAFPGFKPTCNRNPETHPSPLRSWSQLRIREGPVQTRSKKVPGANSVRGGLSRDSRLPPQSSAPRFLAIWFTFRLTFP